MIWQCQQLSCTSFKIKVSHQKSIKNDFSCWCFFGCKQSATHSERSRNPLLGCIPSTFDRPVEKHCNRLCLTHRRVIIGSTQRRLEILSYSIFFFNCTRYRIESVLADPQNSQYRIGSGKMVSLHPYSKSHPYPWSQSTSSISIPTKTHTSSDLEDCQKHLVEDYRPDKQGNLIWLANIPQVQSIQSISTVHFLKLHVPLKCYNST